MKIDEIEATSEHIKLLVKDIEKYAKEHWMSHIDILGREGWERALDGYDRQAVLLRKKIL